MSPNTLKEMLKLYIGLVLVLTEVLLDDDFFNFQQHDYILTPERLEIPRYDKQYVKFAEVRTFKYNRTTPLSNGTVTFNVDVGNEIEVVVQAYKFLSNEYRLFPLRFQENLCTVFDKNNIGIDEIKKCGNITGRSFKKNIKYYFCNWTTNQSKFPPMIPNGKYRVEFQFIYHGIELGVVYRYAEVTRPLTWE